MNSKQRVSALLIGTALLAAACGGSAAALEAEVAALPEASGEPVEPGPDSSPNETNESEQKEIDPETAQLQYSQCLEDKGVEDPFANADQEGGVITLDADGTDDSFEEFQEADKECGKIFDEAFGDFELSPEQEAEFKDAELAFNTCMAEKGFDFGGLDGSGSSGAIRLDDDVDFSALEEASKECGAAFDSLEGVSIGGVATGE